MGHAAVEVGVVALVDARLPGQMELCAEEAVKVWRTDEAAELEAENQDSAAPDVREDLSEDLVVFVPSRAWVRNEDGPGGVG